MFTRRQGTGTKSYGSSWLGFSIQQPGKRNQKQSSLCRVIVIVSDSVSSGRRYPLRYLPKAIKELFSDLLGHAGHHRAQGEDNKAVVSWALYKLFQVLRGGGKRHTNATQTRSSTLFRNRCTILNNHKTFYRAFSTHGPVFPLVLAKLQNSAFSLAQISHAESSRGAEEAHSFTMLWARSWKSLHNVKTIRSTSDIYLHIQFQSCSTEKGLLKVYIICCRQLW